MALPLPHLRHMFAAKGFRVAYLIQASEAADVPGLGDLAQSVRDGLIPPTTPEVVAVHDATGGYPPVALALPVGNADAALLIAGDLATAHDVLDALEEAFDGFLAQARAGTFN